MELILKKNKPLIENYEDLKNRKLLQFTINGNEFSAENTKESITLFAFFVELKEKKQSRWLFQSQICRIWAS